MNRIINAHTPLGDDLLFSALSGREEISRLFDFTLELKSLQRSIPVKALLGQSITLEMAIEGNAKRYLNAQCSHFQATGKAGRYYVYEARLRPWLWYASRRSDYKIFQQMTVPEIVLDVLGKNYPFPVDNRLTASYRTWDYNVQYRETDFNFVSRLMEHEGIYYYFEHTMGEHTLVLCDGLNAHSPFPGYATVPFYMPDSAHTGEDYFDTWAVGQAHRQWRLPDRRLRFQETVRRTDHQPRQTPAAPARQLRNLRLPGRPYRNRRRRPLQPGTYGRTASRP